jgi:hypothetical protein
MPRDLFWFWWDGFDAAYWLVNQRLQSHLLGFGYNEPAD